MPFLQRFKVGAKLALGFGAVLSAILVVALGIYPQPVISLVQGFQHVVLR